MTPPTVDRFRYPWPRIVTGETYTAVVHWQDDADQSAFTFEMLMVDAYTATPVTGVEFVVDDTDADVGLIVATATIPADVDKAAMYELRFRRDDETLIIGPAVFALSTVPAVTP